MPDQSHNRIGDESDGDPDWHPDEKAEHSAVIARGGRSEVSHPPEVSDNCTNEHDGRAPPLAIRPLRFDTHAITSAFGTGVHGELGLNPSH